MPDFGYLQAPPQDTNNMGGISISQPSGQTQQVQPDVNPFDAAALNLQKSKDPSWYSSDKFNEPLYQVDRSTLQRYDSGYNPNNENTEFQYADKQGWLSRTKNNLLKFGANAVGAFVDGIVAIPATIAGIATGDSSMAFNNPITNGIADWQKQLETTLPNYETLYKHNNPLLSYLTPWNFTTWMDNATGVVKNLGFTVGSIAATYATMGLAEEFLLPKILSKVGQFGKVAAGGEEALTSYTNAVNAGKSVDEALTSAYRTAKIADGIHYNLSLLGSSLGESVVEGNQAKTELDAQLKKDYYNTHGREASGEDLQKITDASNNAGMVTTLSNVALLSITNGLTIGSLLKPAEAAKEAAENTILKGLKVSEKNVNLIENTAEKTGAKNYFTKLTQPESLIRQNLGEAFEEFSQTGIQGSTEDYYKRKFDDDSIDTVSNLKQSLTKGLSDAFTTTQGLESGLLGFLGGALSHIVTSSVAKARGNNEGFVVNNALTNLNSQTLTGLFGGASGEAVTATSIQSDMQKALQTGNIFDYKNLKHQLLFNFVKSGIDAGKFDLRIDQLQQLKDLNNDNFTALFGIEFNNSNRQNVSNYVDNVISKANEIKEDVDKVNRLFKNNNEPGTQDHFAYNLYKDQLALSLSENRDNRQRQQSLNNEILSITTILSTDSLLGLVSKEGIDETIEKFNKRIEDLKESEKLSENNEELLQDFKKERLFLEDKLSILKYDNIRKSDPDLYFSAIHELMNYYANGNSEDSKNNLNLISALSVFNKTSDIYKLGKRNTLTNEYFKTLVNNKGFDNFKDILFEQIQNQKDRIRIDDNGNFTRLTKEQMDAEESANIKEQTKETTDHLTNNVGVQSKQEANQKIDEEDKTVIANLIDPNHETDSDPDSLGKKILDGRQPITDNIKEKAKAIAEQHFDNVAAVETKAQIRERKEREQNERLGLTDASYDPYEGEPFDPDIKLQDKNEVVGIPKSEAVKRMFFFNRIDPRKLFNKIFSPNKTDIKFSDNLRTLLFSTSSLNEINEKIFNTLHVEVSPSTKGKTKDDFINHPIFKNLYRRGYDTDIALFSNNKPIGFITPAETLYYKKDGGFTSVSNLSKEEYFNVTGNGDNSYTEFMSEIKDYQNAINKLLINYKGEKIKIDNNQLLSIFRPIISYGSYEGTNKSNKATILKDLPYKGKNDSIVSFPMIYNEETGESERSSIPTIIGASKLSEQRIEEIQDYVARHLDELHRLDGRYIYLMEMPNGEFKYFRARPKNETIENINQLANDLKDIITNGDNKSIKELNERIRNEFYIASQQGKIRRTNLTLSVNKEGDLQLSIINKQILSKPRIVTFNKEDISRIETFSDLKDLLNSKIQEASRGDLNLKGLKIDITDESFKNAILPDEKVTMKDLQDKLTIPITKNSFSDFSMSLLPNQNKENIVPIGSNVTVTSADGTILGENAKVTAISPDGAYVQTDLGNAYVPVNQVSKNENTKEIVPKSADIVADNFKNVIEELKNKGLVKTNC